VNGDVVVCLKQYDSALKSANDDKRRIEQFQEEPQ